MMIKRTNRRRYAQACKSLQAATQTQKWLGVAYAHIPTKKAFGAFSRIAYWIDKKRRG